MNHLYYTIFNFAPIPTTTTTFSHATSPFPQNFPPKITPFRLHSTKNPRNVLGTSQERFGNVSGIRAVFTFGQLKVATATQELFRKNILQWWERCQRCSYRGKTRTSGMTLGARESRWRTERRLGVSPMLWCAVTMVLAMRADVVGMASRVLHEVNAEDEIENGTFRGVPGTLGFCTLFEYIIEDYSAWWCK